LGWRIRREGLTFKHLLLPTSQHLRRDLGRSVLILVPLAALSALILGGAVVLSPTANLQVSGPLINPLGLPWQVGISVLLIPLSSGVTEELVYRGYVLPRLVALTGKQWQANAIMAVGFGLQHVAFLLVDWHLALAMGVVMTIVGGGFGLAYLAIHQRLVPLILLHWQADLFALGIAPLVLWVVFK
jgi:membrane protease YdiL (CAAX protease family)